MSYTKSLSYKYGHDEDYEDEGRSYSGGSNESYFESDLESEYTTAASGKRLRTFNSGKEEDIKKIERRPTRVPNLKIQNRNALLARENRKRKKEMMENLERSVSDLKEENRELHKIVKMKNFKINQLNREVAYLRSVISNKKEIFSILKSLPQEISMKAVPNQVTLENDLESDTTKSCSSSSPNDLDIVSTDWDEILQNPFTELSETPSSKEALSTIDHNYSSYDETALPGICLHVNSGRVSLEFCAACHFNNS